MYLSGNDTAPTFASATVNGTSLVLTFNENLGAATNLANSGFAVQVGGSPVTLSSSDAPVISGTTVTLTLATAVAVGATVTVSYTKPTTGSNNKLVDTANNEVATFADQPVTNNTASQPNTTPTASDGTVTTTEDTAYTFFASDFNYTDADRDPLASVRIVTLPALGTLKLNNTNVTAGNAVTTTRLDNGHLTYTPPANAHGTPYTTFTFTVNDGTDDSTSPATMTINVTPMANSPATGAPTITGTAQVGQTLTAVTTAIMDADGLTSVVYTYQWIRVATDTTEMNIARATASTYTLVEADQGTTIKVTVRFTDDASNPETRTSTATMAVAAAPKVTLDLSPPSISETGTASTRVTASLDKPSSAPTTVTVMAPAGDVTLGGNRTMTIPANSLQVAGNLVTLTAVDNDIHGPARKIVQVSGTTNNPLVADPDPVDLEIVDDDGAPTVELVLTPQQISEPGGVSTVTARLMNGSGMSSEVTTVVVSAAAVSPAVAGDFELSTNPTLTIAAGMTASTGVVTLTAVNNDIDAPNKQVTVSGTATNDYGIAGNPASQPLLITDDEGPPRVTLTLLPDAIINESDVDNSVTVMVTLSHPSSENTTVTVTADPPEAVTPISPMLTILAGFREGSVSLTAVDNDIDGPETQTVAVSAVATNALGVTNPTDALPLTITDDDAPPVVTLMLSETSIDEHSGQSTVTATLDRASSQQIVVTVARDPAYTLSPNTSLTFPAGETASQGTVTLTATDNDIDAEDAVVSVGGTTNPSGLTVNAAMLTIRDDDTRVVMVSKDTLSIREHNEGETPARDTYTVVLESQPTATVEIAIAVLAPHEAAVLVSPTPLRFTPSNWQTAQLVTVTTTPDADANERTATITHTVTGGDYGANTVTAADVTVTVTDDESLSTAVTLRVNREEVSEGAGNTQVTVTGELNGAPRTADTVVTVAVTAGTATLGTDFSVSNVTPLTIARDQVRGTMTFTLTPVDDNMDEPAETVTVEGSTTVTALTGGVTETTVTITDNDAAPPVTLEVSPPQISENGGVSTVTATLSHPSSEDTTVEVSVAPVSPAVGAYFTQFGTFLTIMAGDTASSGSVTIEAADNEADEADKQVSVRGLATNPHGVQSPNVGPVTVTITDDDAPEVTGETNDPRYVEGGSGPVATYTATNPANVPLTWSVIGTDAEFFTIPNGVLGFKQSPDFEASRGSVYQVTVQASDGTFTSEPLAVTVMVLDALGEVSLSSSQPQVGVALTATVSDDLDGVDPAPATPDDMVLEAVPPPRLPGR